MNPAVESSRVFCPLCGARVYARDLPEHVAECRKIEHETRERFE